jgi:hypothetical protein
MVSENERVVRVGNEEAVPEVVRALEAAGSQVRHRVGRVLVIEAPSETRARLTDLPGGARLVTAQEALDDSGALNDAEALAVRAILLRQTSEYQEAKRARPHRDQEWGTGDLLAPDADAIETAPLRRRRPGESPGVTETTGRGDPTAAGADAAAVGEPDPLSERLINKVAVGVVLVNGVDPGYVLSATDRTAAIADVQEGLDWLGAQESDAKVSWSYDVRTVTVDIEPWQGARWKGLPESFYKGIDAALFREDNDHLYFFKGDQYVRFAPGSTTVDGGYPKPIAGNWPGLPASFQSGIDAALWRESNGAVYFFKGNQYVRFTKVSDGVDAGYPTTIAPNWPGLPTSFQSGIDAALMRKSNHKIYFFKDNQYVRFSDVSQGVDAGYPKPLTPNWPGLDSSFAAGIDAAVWRGDNSKIYFFKDGRFNGNYLRYSDVSAGVDAGYPKPIGLSTSEAELLWRDPAMALLGYPAGDTGVQQYVEDIRDRLGTDWTYAAFITRHPVNWFAYAGLPRVVMAFGSSGISDMVFAHETGHIFGAPDEYASSNCTCGSAAGRFFRAPNDNCANCTPDEAALCVMRNNSEAICTHTPKHFGWGPFLVKLDAAVWRADNAKAYLFSDDEYIRYSDISLGRDDDYPKPLVGNWGGLPASFQSGIDAALFREDNDHLYFFKGNQYVRFAPGSTTVDGGYPKPIAGNWPGLPASFQSGIDAALWRESNGAVYFFKGNQYVRFTKVSDGVDNGYPTAIANNWPGLPASFQSGIDAALMRKDNHKIYFFKGRQYVRYSNVSDGIDAGYPNWIDRNWMPFPR